MSKHINFFGYSLWISDGKEETPIELLSSTRPFYSPSVLAAYCIFTNFAVGTLLYGINVSRRGYLWRGSLLALLSVLFLMVKVFVSTSNRYAIAQSGILLNALVAICLYKIEKPSFDRAIRNGGKQARWWLPLVWIVAIASILLLLQLFLP